MIGHRSWGRRRLATLGVVSAITIVLVALVGGLAPSLLPGTLVERDARWVATAAIFAASYVALAIGKVPGLSIDRAGVALVGACLMVARARCRSTTPTRPSISTRSPAARHDDRRRQSAPVRLFRVGQRLGLRAGPSAACVAGRGHRRSSGVFSAFLVNDAICLVLAPLVRRADAGAAAQPGALSAGGGDGLECRLDRDHHRQSAEHDDRQLLTHPLRAISRRRWRRWRCSGWC